MRSMVEAALAYAEKGYHVFPVVQGGKEPLPGSRGFYDATLDLNMVEEMWGGIYGKANIALATGNYLVIDFDKGSTWPDGDLEILEALGHGVIATTPNGGHHHFFAVPQGHTWKCTNGSIALRVDTRATGGYVLVSPSIVDGKNYRWRTELPTLAELPLPSLCLIEILDRTCAGGATVPVVQRTNSTKGKLVQSKETFHGQDILEGKRDSTLTSYAGSMRRIGMGYEEIYGGLSAINALRCKPPKPEKDVIRIAKSVSRYEPDYQATVTNEHIDIGPGFIPEDILADPGPLDPELLAMPGFVGELMEYTMSVSPYPNRCMAFSGALAMFSLLTGRKVCDLMNTRTNLYILGLAPSGAGKNRPRQTNLELAMQVGIDTLLVDRFASGEGIEDALFRNPAMLVQSDEIDGMLQSITSSRDARFENLMGGMLSLYTASHHTYNLRVKANDTEARSVYSPHLVMLGTAIPIHFYSALNERLLTNGFFSRMLIMEDNSKRVAQDLETAIVPIPERLIEEAEKWTNFQVGADGRALERPVPLLVKQTPDATASFLAFRSAADTEWNRTNEKHDSVGTAVWSRAYELVRKLALLSACSVSFESLRIEEAHVTWAAKIVVHQVRRMLFMAQEHVAATVTDEQCKSLLTFLKKAKRDRLPRGMLLKKSKMLAKELEVYVATLIERGDIIEDVIVNEKTGRGTTWYQFIRAKKQQPKQLDAPVDNSNPKTGGDVAVRKDISPGKKEQGTGGNYY